MGLLKVGIMSIFLVFYNKLEVDRLMVKGLGKTGRIIARRR